MNGLRVMTHISPRTSNNMRAERPVRRRARSSFSTFHVSSPRKRMTIALDRNQILEIARRHGVSQVRVFGSYARGQQTGISDVDLLVEFEPRRDLFDLIELKQELEQRFGR